MKLVYSVDIFLLTEKPDGSLETGPRNKLGSVVFEDANDAERYKESLGKQGLYAYVFPRVVVPSSVTTEVALAS